MSGRTQHQRPAQPAVPFLLFLLLTVVFSCDHGGEVRTPVPPAETVKPAGLSCSTSRDSFAGETTNNFFTVGRHPWDAARIEVTGSYTICKVTLQMHQENIVPGAAMQNINVRIFDHNSQLDQPGKMIGNASVTIKASTIPETATDITFTDLNTPVTPGTYWIVFQSDSLNMDHYLVVRGTNVTPRGRALSYSANVQALDWTEFYYGHINFVLYGN